jgi:glyoxylate/hydroxypyruvate reductase A
LRGGALMAGLTVVIGSFLEPDLVARIEAAQPSATVVYEPGLLPVPRYRCDHTGPRRELPDTELDRWRKLTARADVFFDFDWLDPASMPQHAPNLRWIQATSAGIGGFMQRTGLNNSGLTVTTAGGIHAVPLAEFALTGALHFVKGVPELRERQDARRWERYTTRQLAGQRVLVVGLGGVGRRVAQSFAALGVDVWGLGRDGENYQVPGLSRVICRADLDEALPQIDVLVLASPLTAQTEGMIGAAQIGLLKPDAVVVNIARGPLIDQAALTAALRDGRIAGACLDVFATEPLPPDDPLWALDNVILSPHSASTVVTENASLTDLFIDNLDRFRSGAPLRNLYDPVRGY